MDEEKKEPHENEQEIGRLTKDLENEKRRAEEYLMKLSYAQADVENLKKRYDRQLEEAKSYCTEPLIVELLEIVDELELAIESGCSANSAEAVVQGVEMTLKKLKNLLKNEGVSQIESVGRPFDPTKHHAVAKIEKDGVEECTVVEELRKGYVMKEKVIRPSLVKVVVKPSSQSQKEMNSDE